jgi:hypothetical protein
MKYIKYFESSYTKAGEFTFEEDSRGAHHGQVDMTMYMYLGDKIVAKVDYTIYNNEINIQFIESFVKGKGYGQELMKQLSKKYGYENLKRSSLTSDGAKLRSKLDKFYNFDYEEYEKSKNKHLSSDILNNIKDQRIKQFIIHITKLGYTKAWDIWRDTEDFKQLRNIYDLNDIAEIADWIKGSQTEYYDLEIEPPTYITDLIEKLSE